MVSRGKHKKKREEKRNSFDIFCKVGNASALLVEHQNQLEKLHDVLISLSALSSLSLSLSLSRSLSFLSLRHLHSSSHFRSSNVLSRSLRSNTALSPLSSPPPLLSPSPLAPPRSLPPPLPLWLMNVRVRREERVRTLTRTVCGSNGALLE